MIIKTKYSFLLLFLFFSCTVLFAQTTVMPLYSGEIPNSIPGSDQEKGKDVLLNISRPTLTVFLPVKERYTGAAIIICPGGGYGSLYIKREGYDVAEEFAKNGVAAFVLKYRLPSSSTMKDKAIGPLQDAQKAIKIIRERAAEWGIDPHKIGIMGFSAGGHLAATAGTHFDKAIIDNKERTSLRPDFMILIYPVISFNASFGHRPSAVNLLGDSPSDSLLREYSNELQVSKQTPTTFLAHAGDDKSVPTANSIKFYEALNQNSIPAELHVYAKGGHGFLSYPPFKDWMALCNNWMKMNGWMQ
jgi:acetyl esterase/lipase